MRSLFLALAVFSLLRRLNPDKDERVALAASTLATKHCEFANS